MAWFVRYLLMPVTVVGSGVTLGVVHGAARAAYGDAVSGLLALAAAIPVWCSFVLVFEWIEPCAGTMRRRPRGRIVTDAIFSTLSAAFMGLGHAAITRLPEQGVLGQASGALRLYEASFAVQVVVVFLVSELILYAWHYAEHRSGSGLLWSFHRFHHRAPEMMSVTGGRASAVDLLMATLAVGVVRVLGVGGDAVLWCLWYSTILGSLHHSDLDVRLGWFNWVVPGPHQHHIHHSIDPERAGNFATNLPLLDLVFGTAAPLTKPGTEPLGIAGEPERF